MSTNLKPIRSWAGLPPRSTTNPPMIKPMMSEILMSENQNSLSANHLVPKKLTETERTRSMVMNPASFPVVISVQKPRIRVACGKMGSASRLCVDYIKERSLTEMISVGREMIPE